MPATQKYILLFLFLILCVCCILSISLGAVKIPLVNLFSIICYKLNIPIEYRHTDQQLAVFATLRIPRMLLGVLIGATLSMCGASIQGLFRNPLAEPGLIGISSGASLFAIIMIVLEVKVFHFISAQIGFYALAIAAFIGALVTTFVVYRFSVRQGRTDIASLLLIGIAINALVGAFIGILTYMANDEQLRNITFWSLGSLGAANYKVVTTYLPFSLICMSGLLMCAKPLNAIALGESQAEHLGVPLQKVKRMIVLLAAIGVGASVSLTGIIGFISLVVPHILRMMVTGEHRFLLPGSALLGASILVLSDLMARTLASPAELPIGILTACIGVPVFLYIILKERRIRRVI